jgi:HEPN domain-containing protein
MVDIDKITAYWREGAEEDMQVARELVESGRIRHGLFFAHLALEKALKANIVRHTGAEPPKIHALLRLADLAGVEVARERAEILAEMNRFCILARYPEDPQQTPSPDEAGYYLARSLQVFEWLMNLS